MTLSLQSFVCFVFLFCFSSGVKAQQARCDATAFDALPVVTVNDLAAPIILMGELHGNEQSPDLTAALICRLALEGKRVLLALEAPENVQIPVHVGTGSVSFQKNDDGLSQSYWLTEKPHGRTSHAIVDMLHRATKVADVKFVDVAWPWTGRPVGNRDQHMANQLIKHRESRRYDTIVFHGGNLHTQLITREEKRFTAIADYLPSEQVVSIAIFSAGGSSWVCWAGQECGPHAMGSGPKLSAPLVIDETQNPGSPYTFVIRLPEFTPSYPLRRAPVDSAAQE